METRRLLIQSALTFALVLAPGTDWAGESKGSPMATLNDPVVRSALMAAKNKLDRAPER